MWEAVSPSSPLTIIGCGKMGGALARGWLKAGVPESNFLIVDPVAAKTGVSGVSCSCVFPSIEDLPRDVFPSIFVLAIKPQIFADILPHLEGYLSHDPLFLSVAAGISVQSMRGMLGENSGQAAIVRAMPNTPAAIGKGISALYAADTVSEDQKQVAAAMMKVVGKTVWVDSEDQMNAVTGLSGSGPAYVFHMVEALANAGVVMGLSEDVAMELARETVVGAGALMDHDSRTVRDLRVEVTSPNGTTAAGLDVLMGTDPSLSQLMRNTVRAAKKRAEELSAPS